MIMIRRDLDNTSCFGTKGRPSSQNDAWGNTYKNPTHRPVNYRNTIALGENF